MLSGHIYWFYHYGHQKDKDYSLHQRSPSRAPKKRLNAFSGVSITKVSRYRVTDERRWARDRWAHFLLRLGAYKKIALLEITDKQKRPSLDRRLSIVKERLISRNRRYISLEAYTRNTMVVHNVTLWLQNCAKAFISVTESSSATRVFLFSDHESTLS